MYAKYVTKTTSTQSQVINDLALLLSGSPVSALSQSCDKPNCTLISTVAPGWTLADITAPAMGCILRAPDADALTIKTAYLYQGNTTNIALGAYESWNTTTKTGVNSATPSLTLGYSAAVANTYIVFATARSFYITNVLGTDGLGLFEYTRECRYLINSTYPSFAILDSYRNTAFQFPVTTTSTPDLSLASNPRTKNLFGSGDFTGNNAGVVLASVTSKNSYVNSFSSLANLGITYRSPPKLFDALGNPYFELRPLWAMSHSNLVSTSIASTTNHSGAILGKFYDIWETSNGVGNNLDTLNDGTSTFVIMKISNNSTFAFRKA